MPTHRLKDVDSVILHHCRQDSVALYGLLKFVPRGTLYRHVAHLVGAGLLAKRGRAYHTTERGRRRLAERTTNVNWTIWDSIYRPMTHLPSVPHRALTELTMAAVVARRAGIREDHHPAFLAMGPTLTWKTSQALFICHMLGLIPSEVVLDLTTESGRSLLFRRDGRGTLVFKRALLDGSFIVFDDVLEAEIAVRPTLHHFLSGRTVVPVENSLLNIRPVSFLTLNPRRKATLEEQTALTPAQLRRLVVVDFGTVTLPDLARMGQHALEAAVQYGPLTLSAPTANAEPWRPQIVGLMRHVLMPHAWARVDTEMVIVLTTGMTAFIGDIERAIQQTVYDYAVTAETVGWMLPGWLEAVSQFSLHQPIPAPRRTNGQSEESGTVEEVIMLRRSAMEGYKESGLPQFHISDDVKARIIAVAVDEDLPFDCVLEIVLDYYLQIKKQGRDLNELHSVMALSKELSERSIPVQDVKRALKFRQVFREGEYTPEEFEAALALLPVLRAHGLAASDDHMETAFRIAAQLLRSPRSLADLEAWLNETTD